MFRNFRRYLVCLRGVSPQMERSKSSQGDRVGWPLAIMHHSQLHSVIGFVCLMDSYFGNVMVIYLISLWVYSYDIHVQAISRVVGVT